MASSEAARSPDANGESAPKRIKLDHPVDNESVPTDPRDSSTSRQKGVAPIKAEYVMSSKPGQGGQPEADDDAAEAAGHKSQNPNAGSGRTKNKKRGQNTNRHFGSTNDAIQLCSSRALKPEFSPGQCPFGEGCKYEHDLRKYLKDGKLLDLTTFDGKCPVFDALGFCPTGWKCRFVGSHSEERDTEDGRKELVLLENAEPQARLAGFSSPADDQGVGIVNSVSRDAKIDLSRKRTPFPKSDAFLQWLAKMDRKNQRPDTSNESGQNGPAEADSQSPKEDNRAQYVEPPMRPSEKRRLYYGPETPILAPLTTQGNLPFRRLCIDLGAQFTWSEMAMGLPLIQGQKSEWALLRAHEAEMTAPKFASKNTVVEGYDHSKDFRFGAQVAANKPWLAVKTAEAVTTLCPHLRAIDLNCGCPIDMVFKQGAGSALLEQPARMEKILRGMNAASGEIPITVKIRTGTKDNRPVAEKLIQRLAFGSPDTQDAHLGPPGVAAITLHGRSRQQRYTRRADWGYIAECAALINRLNQQRDEQTDTAAEADGRDQANGGHVYFVGNGDCYSHEDYSRQLQDAKVDAVMIGRGALIKPWIFEEVEQGQYLDKSASERLGYIEQFVRYGLQTWGSDEIGVGTTRRFLLEWLSFSCRYIPIGLLEYLPPQINDRPPPYRGRNEMETLLASTNYKDWIKISEMFLGPAHPDFKFEPKHKSNSYEIDAEG